MAKLHIFAKLDFVTLYAPSAIDISETLDPQEEDCRLLLRGPEILNSRIKSSGNLGVLKV